MTDIAIGQTGHLMDEEIDKKETQPREYGEECEIACLGKNAWADSTKTPELREHIFYC